MRLFYAVFLPEEVRRALAEAQEKASRYKGWKEVPPHQLHLTLLFLGERPEGDLEDLFALGHRLGRQVSPFTAFLRGTGYFPNEGTPRVWFAKAEGEGFGPLAEGLRAGVRELFGEEALRAGGDKAFKPHITLARRKAPAPRVPPVVFGLSWPVREFALVRSELRPRGPIYTILEKFPLRGEHGREQEESPGERPKDH
ncbi:2'-5' RNA ligase [Thermus arciformis]|uniref:RNA 2',3'-cyclic phosphodiesterase n=1 Tax=Thermus arciformis TaxID=482827 RepID=A0A1G7FWU6_9DEIN|nr:RNA 2',3'-cyclic phosphodiesterase [Thermus arciformis]SDE80374.1 2'-5' RNA ligase [Thermus arciformis]